MSLSKLATYALEHLSKTSQNLTLNAIAEKIKVIAQRKAYFGPAEKNKILQKQDTAQKVEKVNPHEDETESAVWYWELTTIDYLPSNEYQALVKKNRSTLRKLGAFFKACRQLLYTLEDMTKKKMNETALSAKLVEHEERVLKYEREEEKQRLLQKQKEVEKQKKIKALEEKKIQREAKKLETEAKRQKLKEEKEKERKAQVLKAEQEKQAEKEAEMKVTERNKQFFASFVVKKKKVNGATFGRSDLAFSSHANHTQKSSDGTTKMLKICQESEGDCINDSMACVFDSKTFWSSINAQKSAQSTILQDLRSNLSDRARKSKKKTAKLFPITVDVVANDAIRMINDNSFTPLGDSYSEQKVLMLRDKIKHLQFREDFRPAYHGTWTKTSRIITGRKPFNKDTTLLDYDYDSEAEWEEEEEEGEAVDDDDDDSDSIIDAETGQNAKELDYNDGWLMEDDDFGSDDDEEERELRRRAKKDQSSLDSQKLISITPTFGGSALVVSETMSREERALMSDKVTHVIFPDVEICLDPFEQEVYTESASNLAQAVGDKNLTVVTPSKEGLDKDELRSFCTFVHNSTLSSKDKVVDEFRMQFPTIFDKSRAAAIRKLDCIADKKRTQRGYIWEVKDDVLNECGLSNLIQKKNISSSSGHITVSPNLSPEITPTLKGRKRDSNESGDQVLSSKKSKTKLGNDEKSNDNTKKDRQTSRTPKITLHNFFNRAAKSSKN